LLSCLIDGGATLWQLGAAARGCDAVVTALLESEPGLLSGVEWFVGTGRWEAVGSASAQIGQRRQHLTMLVKVILGNWQLVYQHVG
jgi:hypothetical protein